jgi:hypothetical protein
LISFVFFFAFRFSLFSFVYEEIVQVWVLSFDSCKLG